MDCRRCGKSFDSKKYLLQHLHKRRPCKTLNETIEVAVYITELTTKEQLTLHECQVCHKSFRHLTSLSRHKKSCQSGSLITPDRISELEQKITTLQEEMKLLKEGASSSVIQNTTNNTIGSTIDNSVDNSTTSNIQINNYFNAPIEKLAEHLLNHPQFKTLMLESIKDVKDGLKMIMSNLFFSKQHPENHIIYKESLESDETLCRIATDNWMSMKDTDAISKITQTTDCVLTSFISDPPKELKEEDELAFMDQRALPLKMASGFYEDMDEPERREEQKKEIIEKYRKDITDCSQTIKKVVKKKLIK